jgi:hypothetical protein
MQGQLRMQGQNTAHTHGTPITSGTGKERRLGWGEGEGLS